MKFGLSRLRLAAALSLLLIPAAAPAVPAIQSSTSQAAILSPLGVVKQADLDYGELVVSGAGTAIIDPVSGAMTTSATLVPVAAKYHPAKFTGTGSKNSVVHIRLPTASIALTRVGGTQTVTVSNWTLDGSSNRRIPPSNIFDFAVGATLNVAAGQVPGIYQGTFDVTVQYP
jgi:hypothetical protein